MRSMVTVGVAAFIILGLATTGVAQTTYYACVLKDGTIRMVPPDESCRRNETLISWSGGPPGAGQLRVVDANGLTVGALYPTPAAFMPPWEFTQVGPDINIAVIEVDQKPVGVAVTRNGFVPDLWPELVFVYKDSQCAGTKYMRSPTLLLRGAVGNDNVLYYPGSPLEQYMGWQPLYRKFRDPMGTITCEFGNPLGGWIGVVQQYTLPLYTPPFTVAQ